MKRLRAETITGKRLLCTTTFTAIHCRLRETEILTETIIYKIREMNGQTQFNKYPASGHTIGTNTSCFDMIYFIHTI